MDYKKIIKFYDLDDRSIYHATNWKCYDFIEICVNSPKAEYFLNKRFGYLIFSTHKRIEKKNY